MRNTNDFTTLFRQPMAKAEYDTNSTNISLTPVSGDTTGVLYTLNVQFPPCVIAADRVVSIRTEPMDFEMPYARMQWLVGALGTNQTATWTTDQDNNLQSSTNIPAMRLWGMSVVGLGAGTCLTPNALVFATTPGTVITTYTNFPDATSATDFLWPDQYGLGGTDTSQSPAGFYGLRVDGDF